MCSQVAMQKDVNANEGRLGVTQKVGTISGGEKESGSEIGIPGQS